jgi:hypothetical protein
MLNEEADTAEAGSGTAAGRTESVPPGSLVAGRYRLIRRIGSGGMASVFEAELVNLGRRCALKLLHSDLAARSRSHASVARRACSRGCSTTT